MSDIAERIRKILRLARGAKGHEAEAARQRAAELITKHGLDLSVSLDDEETVLEVVDTDCDPRRKMLAEKVAASRDCKGLANGKAIAMRGHRGAVANARELYLRLSKFAEERISVAPMTEFSMSNARSFFLNPFTEWDQLVRGNASAHAPITTLARAVYRIAFWSSYAQVLAKRLVPDVASPSPMSAPQPMTASDAEAAAEQLKEIIIDKGAKKQRSAPTSSDAEYQAAITDLIQCLAVSGHSQQSTYDLIGALQDRAFTDAYEAGKHIPIEPWSGVAKKRAARLKSAMGLLPPPRQE